MRAGAPDKICLWTDGTYELVKHDNTNLVDYRKHDLHEIFKRCEFILPADEGDIKYANLKFVEGDKFDQSWILLPQITYGEKYCKVIPYGMFVPKDSMVYQTISSTGLKYPKIVDKLTPSQLRDIALNLDNDRLSFRFDHKAIKTTTGSGSRGVLLYDHDRELKYGGKYRSNPSRLELLELCNFAEKEDCDIIVQNLIPDSEVLTKVNVDFVIRDGKFLGYKWDKTDPTAVFTNWNFGWTVRTDYTDGLMGRVADHLINQCGIYNAIMNFEAFSDLTSETWLVEFNWRYSNSMFEGQAAGIDLIGHYLRGEEFQFPEGMNKFTRYWQCSYYNDIPGYNTGK